MYIIAVRSSIICENEIKVNDFNLQIAKIFIFDNKIILKSHNNSGYLKVLMITSVGANWRSSR